MKLLARITAAAVLATAAATTASAQTYPTQPIRMIMPFTPGSPNDVVGRLLAQQMTTRLGQNVVIDNRPGAGTNAGTKAAASAEPNGYTLLFNSSSMVVSPAMYRNPGYDPEKNFVPVANTIFGHWVTVIEKSIPANTVPEFIAYAKKNPGKLAFGSSGPGTGPHMRYEMLRYKTGVDISGLDLPARAAHFFAAGSDALNRGRRRDAEQALAALRTLKPSTAADDEIGRAHV